MSDIPLPQLQQRRKQFTHRWWFWALIILFFGVAGALVAMKQWGGVSPDEQLANLGETVKVERTTVTKVLSTSGSVHAKGTTALFSAATGTVEDVHVDVGDVVEEDALLVTLNIPSAPASLREVRAPFDGKIIALSTFVGDVARPGVPLLSVATKENIITFFASDAEVITLHKGQKVSINIPGVDSAETKRWESVQDISFRKEQDSLSAAQSGSATTGYNITVSAEMIPDDVRQFEDFRVDLEVMIDERENVLAIDRSAVHFENDGSAYVYKKPTIDATFDPASELAKHPLTVGLVGDELVEVKDGLAEGDELLLLLSQADSSPF